MLTCLDRALSRRLRADEDSNCTEAHQSLASSDIFSIIKCHRLQCRRLASRRPLIRYHDLPCRLRCKLPPEVFEDVTMRVEASAGTPALLYEPAIMFPDDDGLERARRVSAYAAQYDATTKRYGLATGGSTRRGPKATPVRIREHPKFPFLSARKAAAAMRMLGHDRTKRSDIRNAIVNGQRCCGFHWEYAPGEARYVLRHEQGVGYTRQELARLLQPPRPQSFPLFAALKPSA